MRIVCSDLDEFLVNLVGGDTSEKIFRGTIHTSRFRRPVDGNKKDAVKFEVVFQASAVIDVEGGQCLLQMGENCGEDYQDASQEYVGSERAAELKARLRDWCDEQGLLLKPGMVDF